MKQNGHPVECITRRTHISVKPWTSALTKVYLWYTDDGKVSWTINGHQRHQQGKKPVSGKITNRSYS